DAQTAQAVERREIFGAKIVVMHFCSTGFQPVPRSSARVKNPCYRKLISEFSRLIAVHPQARDADPVDCPEPDAAHRAFQENVERRVDQERRPEASDEEKHACPSRIATAAGG